MDTGFNVLVGVRPIIVRYDARSDCDLELIESNGGSGTNFRVRFICGQPSFSSAEGSLTRVYLELSALRVFVAIMVCWWR